MSYRHTQELIKNIQNEIKDLRFKLAIFNEICHDMYYDLRKFAPDHIIKKYSKLLYDQDKSTYPEQK